MIQKLNRPLTLLNLFLVLLGLGILAYLGLFNRSWSDDWCFDADFKQKGVISTIGTYFATGDAAQTGYPPNRYSFVTFSGIFYLPGMPGTRILPTVTILLWLGGLVWTVQNLTGRKITKDPLPFLGCSLLLLYTLYFSTSRFQILYWRSGVFPYSWSIVFGLLILGAITSQLPRDHRSTVFVLIVAILSFIGGGFSEIGSAFLVSGFSFLFALTLWERGRSTAWARKLFPTVLAAWIFSILAMIAIAVSPSNSRYGGWDQAPNNLVSVPWIALRYAFDFIFDSFKSLPLPHLIFLLTFVALGILSAQTNETVRKFRTMTVAVLMTAMVTYLLIAAIQAPTVFLTNAPPDPRGQSLSRFVLFAGLAIIGWVLGETVPIQFHAYSSILASLVLVSCAVYTARADVKLYRELPSFIRRAEQWDARDIYIKESIARGITRIEIDAIDTSLIDTRDIIRSKDFGTWMTDICGAHYYGAEALRVGP